jgi:glycolate oxidase FAD binding subunit
VAHGAGRARVVAMTVVAIDSVATARDRVLDAANRGIGLRIAGSGTWLDAGRPVLASETISTRELSGIVEYVPGDLTLTARAGTTMAEVREATSAHGQWLALDPPGSTDGTLGAVVSTASSGPLRTYFGTPRDLVLGVEFITGTGAVARGGGRVVKNVAGFDLTRLITGSWGSLGVITEVTVRLHARPQADETIGVAMGGDEAISRARQLLRRLPFTPYAFEIVNGVLGQGIGGSGAMAVVRLGGNTEAVRAQRAALGELGDARELDPNLWNVFAAIEPDQAMVFRLSGLSTDIESTWRAASGLASQIEGMMIHATPARGAVRCIVPSTPNAVATLRRAFASLPTAGRIGERLPAELWSLCSPPPTGDPISAGIKQTFDPRGVLNPGIFGEPT